VKTTLDLPNDLVREMKLRAINEGRKLKDTAADLLRRGLDSASGKTPDLSQRPRITKQRNGLPLIHCSPNAPVTRMAADEIIALEQETLSSEDQQRLGHSL
jgi:plasmid stability protein